MKPTICDIETYPNYTLYAFKKGKKVTTFELFGEGERWGFKDIKKIRKMLSKNLIITFNGLNYDIPMIDIAINKRITVDQTDSELCPKFYFLLGLAAKNRSDMRLTNTDYSVRYAMAVSVTHCFLFAIYFLYDPISALIFKRQRELIPADFVQQ